MSVSESPRAATRFAAAALSVGGLVGLAANHLMLNGSIANDIVAGIDVLVGVAIWFLPWDRWPARATLVLAPIGLTLIGASRAIGSTPSATFVASFVMVFMWVGVSQPPGTSFWLAGPAVVAYLVPTMLAAHHDPNEFGALTVVLPVLVLAGEAPARMVAELRRAHAAERDYAMRCEDDARTDELTGLGNRRMGERLLSTLVPGDAVLLVDLDHFKDVNDRFGHAGGDRVLRDLGVYLRSTAEENDTIARFGGDEFLIVARGAGERAVRVAQALADGWRDQQPLATCSIGVAVHDSRRPVSDTYSRADTALYRAKQAGRDQVRDFGADPSHVMGHLAAL
ncbi:MAG TPA: GGDEF domain-containing protein [Acidimicrobiales bacterium]|jgi:diguanylate cyclase (GGDEF)-like protein